MGDLSKINYDSYRPRGCKFLHKIILPFQLTSFTALTQFDYGAFAKYAKDRGPPGLSASGDMSQF